jgi:four helix bundle protein
VCDCYCTTETCPPSERYGLSGELRRSALSIPSNIAEGDGRDTPKEFIRFRRITYGSGCELETHVPIAIRLSYGDRSNLESIASEVEQIRRMLFAIIRQVQADL